MAEDEPAGNLGRADQFAFEQLVERPESLVAVELANLTREVGIERLAGDRRAFEQRCGRRGQGGDLLGQRGRDPGGHPAATAPASAASSAPGWSSLASCSR